MIGDFIMYPTVFNTLFNDPFFSTTPARQFTSPAVNICESDNAFEIEVAAPGMTKENLNVHVENDSELIVSFDKKATSETDPKRNYIRREFSYGSYRQAFSLPEDIDMEAIKAEMQDGILRITLPKMTETPKVPAKRLIEIQ